MRKSEASALVADVRPDPLQPRQYFRASALNALARSIASVGQRTPIQVRRLADGDPHRYEIIDGERRWRACQIAKIETIRICIEDEDATLSHRKQHFLSLVSNFHREDHTHIEISRALAHQVSLGETISVLANGIDKSDSWVYQYLALQRLAPALQDLMHPDITDQDLVRFAEGVAMAQLTHEQQLEAWDQVKHITPTARLTRLRAVVQELTGKVRRVRPVVARRHLERFVDRLSADLDRVLEMNSNEFSKLVAGASRDDMHEVVTQLKQCRERIDVLTDAFVRAMSVTQPSRQKLAVAGTTRR